MNQSVERALTPPEAQTPQETAETGDVSAEIQSIHTGFQAQLVQSLTEMQRSMERDFTARLDQAVELVRQDLITRINDIRLEIQRVEDLLNTVSREIDEMIEDPNVELSRIMRQKTEQSVLRAYLDGLKFSAGVNTPP